MVAKRVSTQVAFCTLATGNVDTRWRTRWSASIGWLLYKVCITTNYHHTNESPLGPMMMHHRNLVWTLVPPSQVEARIAHTELLGWQSGL